MGGVKAGLRLPLLPVTLPLSLKLFWEKKLSGLSAFDIAEELVRTMDLPKGLQGKLGRVAAALWTLIKWVRFFVLFI